MANEREREGHVVSLKVFSATLSTTVTGSLGLLYVMYNLRGIMQGSKTVDRFQRRDTLMCSQILDIGVK